jgi:uncharacterized protein
MFGISFAKILVLVAVIALIWFGFRWFERWQKESRAAAEKDARLAGGSSPSPRGAPAPAEEMTACRVCGTYVAAGSARACGRPNCPFPR